VSADECHLQGFLIFRDQQSAYMEMERIQVIKC